MNFTSFDSVSENVIVALGAAAMPLLPLSENINLSLQWIKKDGQFSYKVRKILD